uniref:Olfactory receptor family 52 subfamily H member 1 n=1 Tax=Theropithecus gelada TaxID=9565 RepID=A0A8D2FPW7_THEGE
MTMYNVSDHGTSPFTLLGIPGLKQYHVWTSIPFCFIYLVTVMASSILLYLIVVEHSLHAPMFFFLSMLVITDLILSTVCVPKTFSIFWFGSQTISFPGCLTQLFFLHYSFVLDSVILLAMAFDCYMAICSPLRYTTILTPKTIIKIAARICFQSLCVFVPCVFLVNHLPFCIVRLACADISINIWYGFCVPIMMVISDVILIAVSYALILCAVFRLPSQDARQKALSTCGSHVCVILMFYMPAFFSILAHCFGHNVSRTFHIMFANLYIVIPPALNPMVYGVKTKQIRDKVIVLFSTKGTG